VAQTVPPKPDAVRRNARSGVKMLPAAGRTKLAPNWPFEPASLAEADLWKQLWATPQACAWEEHGWARIVARYVRVVLLAEALDKDAMSEARQLEDRLGLTPKAMQMLMWQIAPDELGERRQDSQQTTGSNARERFKAVG
jgi:hypothetical protein